PPTSGLPVIHSVGPDPRVSATNSQIGREVASEATDGAIRSPEDCNVRAAVLPPQTSCGYHRPPYRQGISPLRPWQRLVAPSEPAQDQRARGARCSRDSLPGCSLRYWTSP